MSEELEIKDEVLDLKVTETYDESQIQVLEGLEMCIRDRETPRWYKRRNSWFSFKDTVYFIFS